MTKYRSGRSLATKALALSATMALLAAGAAQAQPDLKITPHAAVSAAGKGSASFNWLAKRTAKPTLVTARVGRPLGTGSYICSPAGFGRKSQCYQR